MPLRTVLVVLVAALLAVQVVRTAALRISPYAGATKLWPSHPRSILNQTMAEVGARSAHGEALPPALLRRVDEIARKMPLAPEPFLIEGALAQLEGREQVAERLYLEARSRDPRSRAARYLMAERYLRSGDAAAALGEMAVLSRLTGQVGVFAPALASYARTPGGVARLRSFFRSSPEFEPAVLSHLAADARNLDLIFALWSGRQPRAEDMFGQWPARIVAALIDRRQYATAYATWRRLAGVQAATPGLFNPEFRKLSAPPPFNWSFGTSGGVAEPAGAGRLQVIYYGREDAVLAEQMLVLAPGRYRLGMQLSGNLKEAAGIAWSIDCLPQQRPILRLPVQQPRSSAAVRADFTVPAQCPAQRLRLAAQPGEFPRTSEFTVTNLELAKAPGR